MRPTKPHPTPRPTQEDRISHTSGPWKVIVGAMDEDFALSVEGAGGMIAAVGPLGEPDEEDQANARLIAAAPELLAALKELDAAICNEDREDNTTISRYFNAQKRARQAIAHAEGRA